MRIPVRHVSEPPEQAAVIPFRGRQRWPALTAARRDDSLPQRFYQRPVPVVAWDLLGCVLISRVRGVVTAGRIVETEAYLGPEDAASHAAFRPSSRALFYGPGGVAYVFQAYGRHLCLNAIAGPRGTPGCVLIRALEPTRGLETMARRRRLPVGAARLGDARLARGPANLTRALGITLGDNGADLRHGRLTIHPPDWPPARAPRDWAVGVGPRIGISRATTRRLRFWVRGHACVSRPRDRARRPAASVS